MDRRADGSLITGRTAAARRWRLDGTGVGQRRTAGRRSTAGRRRSASRPSAGRRTAGRSPDGRRRSAGRSPAAGRRSAPRRPGGGPRPPGGDPAAGLPTADGPSPVAASPLRRRWVARPPSVGGGRADGRPSARARGVPSARATRRCGASGGRSTVRAVTDRTPWRGSGGSRPGPRPCRRSGTRNGPPVTHLDRRGPRRRRRRAVGARR